MINMKIKEFKIINNIMFKKALTLIAFLIIFLIILSFPTLLAFKENQAINNSVSANKIDNKLIIYYFGYKNKYEIIFTNVISLKDLKNIPIEKHILLLDLDLVKDLNMTDNAKEFIKNEITRGNPIIMVGNTKLVNSTLEKSRSFTQIIIPKIIADPNGKERNLDDEKIIFVILSFPDVLSTIKDLNIIPNKIFIRHKTDNLTLIEAYNWIITNNNFFIDKIRLKQYTQTGEPYWVQISQADWSSGNNWCPYGELNVRTLYYKLMNDYSDQYDWYAIHVRQQSVPGILSCSSDYKTSDMYTWIDADYYNSNNMLSDYDPTTTVGATTVGVTLGVTVSSDNSATITVSLSWSYTVPDVIIHDRSDFNQELAKWWHDIDETKPVGSNTYMIEPGAVIRVLNNNVASRVEHYGVKYGHQVLWWWEFTTEGYVEFYVH